MPDERPLESGPPAMLDSASSRVSLRRFLNALKARFKSSLDGEPGVSESGADIVLLVDFGIRMAITDAGNLLGRTRPAAGNASRSTPGHEPDEHAERESEPAILNECLHRVLPFLSF